MAHGLLTTLGVAAVPAQCVCRSAVQSVSATRHPLSDVMEMQDVGFPDRRGDSSRASTDRCPYLPNGRLHPRTTGLQAVQIREEPRGALAGLVRPASRLASASFPRGQAAYPVGMPSDRGLLSLVRRAFKANNHASATTRRRYSANHIPLKRRNRLNRYQWTSDTRLPDRRYVLTPSAFHLSADNPTAISCGLGYRTENLRTVHSSTFVAHHKPSMPGYGIPARNLPHRSSL